MIGQAIETLITAAVRNVDANTGGEVALLAGADALGKPSGIRVCWTESHGVTVALMSQDAEDVFRDGGNCRRCGYVVRLDEQRELKNRRDFAPCLRF